ncbi:hypothetical protein [Luedemannella helvata]
MQLEAPFTGTLHMPDKEFRVQGSPVLLPDGQAVATILWHTWAERFEVLDAVGALVAECRPHGFFRRRYPVMTPDGREVVAVRPGGWRPFNGAEVALARGRSLTIRQVSAWSDRTFEFGDTVGLVGRITPTTRAFSFRPDSYAVELLRPELSALEAISLAQTLRVIARHQRAAGAAA